MIEEKCFEDRVRSGAYETKLPYKDNREAYRADQSSLMDKFYADARAYVINSGVPERYAAKVVSYAWSEGHSCGFSEVLNYMDMLIEIFQ